MAKSRRSPSARLTELLHSPAARRLLALTVLTIGTALLIVDYVRVPTRDFQVGEVAERDVRATTAFQMVDWDATYDRQREAESNVAPVYDFDATLSGRVQSRISGAFETARRRLAESVMEAKASGADDISNEKLWDIAGTFLKQIELSLDPDDVEALVRLRFGHEAEELANELVSSALHKYIVADRELLPSPERSLSVVRILGDDRDELQLDSYTAIGGPDDARREISLQLIEQGPSVREDSDEVRAALAIARAAVRPNFSYNQLLTEGRRREARESVGEVVISVQKGTALVREGDVLSRQQVEMVRALMESRSGYGFGGVLISLIFFCGMFYVGLYQFGAGYLRRFSTRDQDVEAAAFLALLVIALGRLAVEISDVMARVIGMGVAPSSFWYLVPVAGGAMLLRVLVNAETTLIFVLATSAMVGILMDQEVLYTVFFMVSGLVAASSVATTRERAKVLRAGLLTGLVNAALALLISLVQVHLGDSPHAAGAALPLWDVAFAFLGGLGSSIMVLGLVPMFELFGFVTDFRLLELANLNHPLLRQLMLRAPGTYHHSVIVGSLSEAAADAIGGNSLQARVSCYFHDIGKAVKPFHFIENVRDRPNPHDRLQPRQSARIIVNHVLDGEAIAKQYNLPKPILDGIRMHHGTSLIKYFYAMALEQAEPDEVVDDADFRYPGPRPNTREAGIIFLADRVEAACRTLKDPTAESIRRLIQKLVNDAVADGQLEECPLTLQDLYIIIDTFTQTLLGIYHHRIEYPGLPAARLAPGAGGSGTVITLEMDNPLSVEENTGPTPLVREAAAPESTDPVRPDEDH